MPPDDSKPTSKNDSPQANTSSYKRWWKEGDGPAVRRKWSPERRKEEAKDLRLFRAMKKAGVLNDWSKKSFEFEGEVYTMVCRVPDPKKVID